MNFLTEIHVRLFILLGILLRIGLPIWLAVSAIRFFSARTAALRREKAADQAVTRPLGEQIRARRTAKGISQEALAAQLNVSRQAVSKWENGTADPSTANLLALAELFGVSVDALLRG